MAGSGDVLVHPAVQADAARNAGGHGYDFRPMFAALRQQISAADVAICHQETPISSTDHDLTAAGSQYVFYPPREIGTAVRWAGFDGCDNASNHLWDRDVPGLRSTIAVLSHAGLQQSGPSGTGPQGEHIAYYHAHGVTIANIAYTYTIFNTSNGSPDVPAVAPWLVGVMWTRIRAAGIEADARRARAHGADIVVASMHWGDEYHAAVTHDESTLAHQLLGSGVVDAILGAHTHVVQPCQRIDGRYVVYGMGNFLSDQGPGRDPRQSAVNQDGILGTIRFTSNGNGTWSQSLSVQPTFVGLAGHRIERATRTSNPASLARTTAALHALGAGSCPVKVLTR